MKMRVIITLPTRVVTVLVPEEQLTERLGVLLTDYGIHCNVRIERVQAEEK